MSLMNMMETIHKGFDWSSSHFYSHMALWIVAVGFLPFLLTCFAIEEAERTLLVVLYEIWSILAVMDEKLSLLFNAVDAVWKLINPLQASDTTRHT